MSKKLVFYTNPRSRGRIVRWMLEELGINYETKVIEYGAAMKSPEYLAINPMGKVPAIQYGEEVVTESAAICTYLAETFPDAGLAPLPEEKGNYYRWLFFAAGPLEQATALKGLDINIPAEKQGMLGFGNFEITLNALSKALMDNPYIAGNRFTAADVYVGLSIGWGMQFGMIEKRSEFVEYWERISQRPAYLRAQKLDDELIPKA
ncbi:glutathione S-transferase family protein [Aquella oligotrophica]|uniref:Glutathione S-transferase n=1 Tax=Aquella oligotrophica TaxID=2067065 RepID=A0A2I7N3I0_9NEIS|nr:glutathione S-transferase family protein [Aquella oligotrophica]AUR51014.1 glutathione S-transferase [Aquella oligotrophica]